MFLTLWTLLDTHLLPQQPTLSNALCVLVGLGLEFALQMAGSEVGAGVSE